MSERAAIVSPTSSLISPHEMSVSVRGSFMKRRVPEIQTMSEGLIKAHLRGWRDFLTSENEDPRTDIFQKYFIVEHFRKWLDSSAVITSEFTRKYDGQTVETFKGYKDYLSTVLESGRDPRDLDPRRMGPYCQFTLGANASVVSGYNFDLIRESLKLSGKARDDSTLEDCRAQAKTFINSVTSLIDRMLPGEIISSNKYRILTYTSNFIAVTEEDITAVHKVANGLVIADIDRPQVGFGAKYTHNEIENLVYRPEPALSLLKKGSEVVGFYMLHRICDIRSGDILERITYRIRMQGLNPQETGFVQLMGIQDSASLGYYRQNKSRAYEDLINGIFEVAKLQGLKKVFSLVRIGSNANLADKAHNRVGWQDVAGCTYKIGKNEYKLVTKDV